MTRILSLVFDRNEQLLRAVIRTPHGTVKVHWQDGCGDLCWFTSGSGEARRAAVAVIERIEHTAARL